MTYAPSHQSFPLPHLFNGTVLRHFDPPFVDDEDVDDYPDYEDSSSYGSDFYGFTEDRWFELDWECLDADECDICPFDSPPAITCNQHGYIYSREQLDKGYYVPSYSLSFAEQWRQAQEDTDYGDFDRADDGDEEADSLPSELAAYYGEDLRDDALTLLESAWREERDRYYDGKRKRAYREAISRSASHRRRDLSVGQRGRYGHDSRRYRNAGVRTPYRAYVAKKEVAI